jgi:hypothetical protein
MGSQITKAPIAIEDHTSYPVTAKIKRGQDE